MKKVLEPLTDTIKNTSEDLTKNMMLTSKENNKALENLHNKLLEIMNDRGILKLLWRLLYLKTLLLNVLVNLN